MEVSVTVQDYDYPMVATELLDWMAGRADQRARRRAGGVQAGDYQVVSRRRRPRAGITGSHDLRLKQALACAELNDCAECEFRQACQEEDDRWVEASYRALFRGRKALGSPPQDVV